jgi:hypothetical protein
MYKFTATPHSTVPPSLDVSFRRRIGDNALVASVRLITATLLLLVGGVGVGAYDTTTIDLGRGPVFNTDFSRTVIDHFFALETPEP